MFLSFLKPKITCKELAEKLAPRLVKQVIEGFEEGKRVMGDHAWMIESSNSTTEADKIGEWVLFNIAGYINGCRSSMNQDAIHFEFVRSFIFECGRCLMRRGIFVTESEYERQAMDRVTNYLNMFTGIDIDKEMHNIASAFLKNVACNQDDIASRMVVAGSFMAQSTLTKTMLDGIQKSYRIIL